MPTIQHKRPHVKAISHAVTTTLVGLGASLLVLYRLTGVNTVGIKENLWAEDGLFTVCAHNYTILECTIEPYAGYMLTLQKLLTGLVSLTPVTHWALAANITAAVTSGILSGVTYHVLQANKVKKIVAVFIAYLPLLLPLTGFEAIGSIGSLYMLLLYTTTIALMYYTSKTREKIITSILLLLSILTIPSAFALIIGIIVLYYRKKINIKLATVYSSILLIGLVAQLALGRSGVNQRNTAITTESLQTWIEYLPKYLATYIPGLYYKENETFDYFTIQTLPNLGLYITIILAGIGVYSVVKRNEKIGALILVGLSYGLIPVLTGYANNRYFILPLAIVAAAGMLGLSTKISTTKTACILAGVTILWIPALEASEFRKKPNPPWSSQLETINNTCTENNKKTSSGDAQKILLQFTPEWPRSETILEEKTQPYFYCK